MKICSKCKELKTLEEFRNKTKSKDGKQPWCTKCFSEYEKKRYHNGDNLRKRANEERRIQANKKYVKSYLQSHACIGCGDSDWWALDFDHLDRETKYNNISIMIQENGLDKIKNEIAKCQVLCVKCHRKRTMIQMDWWRLVD